MVNIYVYFSSDIPREPLGLADSPLPGRGPGLPPLGGHPTAGSPPGLTNTFPSSNPPKLDQPQLASFLLGPKFGGLATPQPHTSSLALWLLSPRPLSSVPSVHSLAGGQGRRLPAFLPQACLAPSCGCRDLIYRERPVAAASPATAGLRSPHIKAAGPWQGSSWLPIFHSPCCGWGLKNLSLLI